MKCSIQNSNTQCQTLLHGGALVGVLALCFPSGGERPAEQSPQREAGAARFGAHHR